MRIVYLHQYFNTPAMSGGTRSYEMARRLVSWGHEVHMVTSWREPSERRDWYEEVIDGITVHWLPVGYSNKMGFLDRVLAFFRFAIRAAFKASRLSADVVFATSTPLTIALPGAFAAWRQRVPMVFEVRDLWPEVPIALGVLRNPLLVKAAVWLERFAYRHAERIVAVAPGMADEIIAGGFNEKHVAIIPNGCDLELFSGAAAGAVPDQLTVLYIGTVGPANGVEYIPQLAVALKVCHPERRVKFIVIGDGKNLESVRALAASHGLTADEIEFLGALPKNDIPRWLAQSRLTIMTYDGPEVLYRDSVSNKFFDSLAAGKPIVANFSGFSTLVAQAAGVGAILPVDELPRAADRLLALLTDDDYLEQARVRSRTLAVDTFNRDRLARMLEEVLLQAVTLADCDDCEPIGNEFRELWASSRQAAR